MKIRKLHIKNYRVFDDIEFDFTDRDGETLDTVVLAGVNGCGKTTVLEIVRSILCEDERGYQSIWMPKVNLEVEVLEGELSPEQILSNKFFGIGKPSHQNGKLFYLELNNMPNVNILFGAMRRWHRPTAAYFPVGTEGQNVAELSSELITVASLESKRSDMKNTLLKKTRDNLFNNRHQTVDEIVKEEIEELTRTLSGPGLNTKLVDIKSEELVFESANGQRVYFEQLSHGEQNLYFRAIYLSQLNLENAILLIDEPEVAFHPSWQQKIAQLYQQVGTNNQVFMATHSPHIMASVPPDSLFVLDVKEENDGKRKIRAINMGKAGKHSLGVEPNQILEDIMQVKDFRPPETRAKIDRLTALLNLEKFESPEAVALAEELSEQLGRGEPFIIRLEQRLFTLRKQKQNLQPVA